MRENSRVNLAASALLVLVTAIFWQSALAEECIPSIGQTNGLLRLSFLTDPAN